MRAKYAEALVSMYDVRNKVSEYVVEKNEWPDSLQTLGFPNNAILNSHQHEISIYQKGLIAAKVGQNNGKDMFIVFELAVTNEGDIKWTCYGENVSQTHLPSTCRE